MRTKVRPSETIASLAKHTEKVRVALIVNAKHRRAAHSTKMIREREAFRVDDDFSSLHFIGDRESAGTDVGHEVPNW